ncbi:hypothetical protein FIBSPDRAFT_1048746 [Athelia psychrophila]|uniref:SH3 domain-containing protein n=1 Tax=Athelia psychrophila TaxID=1759441 RepID=A0A166DBH3_9AGAM|nr:hypothetical protein FIBSPDRAFT_1048746 [Fibularhizoctonia sp. CBS 109695]
MLVCYALSSGRTKEIVTLSTDTVIFLKTRIQGIEDVSPAHQRLTFAGKTLEDAHTLGYYGVRSGSTIRVATTTEKRRSGRMSWVAGPSPQELGLVDLATAVALWDWDGHMAGNRQEGQTGLKLAQGETVTITKVVNEEWYQGCKDKNTVGYFPRSFVSVQSIAEPMYRDSFGSDGPQEETSQSITVQMQAASPPRWSLSNLLHGLQSFVSVFLCCGPRSHPALPGRPSLPPSPIPPSPAFDRSFGGSRFLIIFTCTPGSRGRYVLRAAMMLDPAEEDGSRFSSLRLNVSLKSGTVLSMSEPIIDTTYAPPMMSAKGNVSKGALSEEDEDEDDHRDAAPLLRVEAQDELDRLSAFSHTTNAVQAQGAGSSNAQWVLKEDLINIDGDGDFKRRGLEPRIVLEAILDVRPAAVVFNVIVGTRVGEGKERAVQSGTLNGWL